jgi:hypothetical protein
MLAAAHRADPEGRVSDPKGRVSEKWIRFSAPDDARTKKEHRIDPKSAFHFWVRCSTVHPPFSYMSGGPVFGHIRI